MTGTILLILRALTAICLYAFIGWALYTLWKELKQTTRLQAKQIAPQLNLVYQQEHGAQHLNILPPKCTIGRDPICECHIDDGTISARHALFSYYQGQWWVEDLNSKNGTFLNEEKVQAPTVLADGDELQCGQAKFLISVEQSS